MDDYSSIDQTLEKRRKVLKKLWTLQKSSKDEQVLESLQPKHLLSTFQLDDPNQVIWWVQHVGMNATTPATKSTQEGVISATLAKQNENRSAKPDLSTIQQSNVATDTKSQNMENDIEDDWLLSRLEEFLVTENSHEPAGDLELRVVRIIQSQAGDEIIQNELLELLGFSDFALELIPKIIQRRGKLKNKKNQKKSSSSTSKVGSGIGRDSGTNNVFIKGATMGGGFLNEKKALPSGTTRSWSELKKVEGVPNSVNARFERVWVPAPPKPTVSANAEDDCIATTRFGKLGQKAFEGVPTLNRLQSRLFHAAYETSENLLVCAPTGAGKTNVAMTAIAREIDKTKNPKSVKVVYVAPMKALAQEVVDKFSQRLATLKMNVRELTGDTQLSRAEIEKTQVVVTTPEKWDVITRKSGGDGTLGELVQLLIIDEVHLVGEDRGPVIEALVARTIRQVERRQQMVRIVGLSATLPNYLDVALFLRVNPERGMFFFDNSFRPVPLEQTFIGVALPASQQTPTTVSNVPGQPVMEESKKAKTAAQVHVIKSQKLLEFAYNELACQFSLESVAKGNQVMVFVHTRKDTSKTARAILELADTKFGNKAPGFGPHVRNIASLHSQYQYRVSKSKNVELQHLYEFGVGIHHAGMAREDRSLTEEMFTKGVISLLCCTATLAWGVNLPAHTVIVKGTQIYAPERGGLCELNSADVFQCFGRAGRPQFDTSGEALLITEHSQLARYLAMLNHALPLESKLVPSLPDAMNAEIVSGTVSSLEEASIWLSYTFLYIRMLKSPTAYGVSYDEREQDPHLETHRMKLVGMAAKRLSEARMIRIGILPTSASDNRQTFLVGGFPPKTPLGVTDLGRVASHYYVHHETVESLFNETLKPVMTYQELIEAICSSKEFEQLKMRDEEVVELKRLVTRSCPFEPTENASFASSTVPGMDLVTSRTKAYILFQTFISKFQVDIFTLHSDMTYISQNAARICRASFEVALSRGWLLLALQTLKLCCCIEKRCWFWPIQHPLRQVAPVVVQLESVAALERMQQQQPQNAYSSYPLISMERETADSLLNKVSSLNYPRATKLIQASKLLPRCTLELVYAQPITSGLLRVTIRVVPRFEWKDRLLGEISQSYYIFVDDGEWILHHERISLLKSQVVKMVSSQDNYERDENGLELTFTVPLFQRPPRTAQEEDDSGEDDYHGRPKYSYYVRIESDSGWLDCGSELEIDLNTIITPTSISSTALSSKSTFFTDLLNLDPISIHALRNKQVEDTLQFSHFNPVQTQCFHVLYHKDESCLIGAPTGSGKTILAELAMWRVLFGDGYENLSKRKPGGIVVYVAPLKALVTERMADWMRKFIKWNKRCIELTGDTNPSQFELNSCDLIVATPEKFEISTRFWDTNENHFLTKVRLVIMDEIHLLGEESRGASLESLVWRLKQFQSRSNRLYPIRLVGLSTALANAKDLADWFKSTSNDHVYVYNFRPAVRIVPLEVHLSGFPGEYYCPRMASMNKPIYHAIDRYSPRKPVLVFVASRRQTRLTAFDLISLCAHSENPKKFVLGDDHGMLEDLQVEDESLKHCLQFGIALHHAGLTTRDRLLSEQLFSQGHCQVLISTSTLAWGVNLPAYMVIIKGTEYFNATKRKYEPFEVTDVLQMMGRAGRPQYGDDKGIALIYVAENLKSFYKRFLYEPFPIESNLLFGKKLESYINVEIASRRVRSLGEIIQFLEGTYLAIRLRQNPSYYGLKLISSHAVQAFFHKLVEQCLNTLKACELVDLGGEEAGWNSSTELRPSRLGEIAARYDLKPQTAKFLLNGLKDKTSRVVDMPSVLELLCKSSEFNDVPPIRHKEDELNEILATSLDYGLGTFKMEDLRSSHLKAFLLLQAKFQGKMESLPIQDYHTDCKQVLDVASRVSPALIEICTVAGVDPVKALAALQVNSQLVTTIHSREAGNSTSSKRSVRAAKDAATIDSATFLASQNAIVCSLSTTTSDAGLRCWLLVFAQDSVNTGKKLVAVERATVSSSSSKQVTVRLRESHDSNRRYSCCVMLEVLIANEAVMKFTEVTGLNNE
jgi:activating signal cointegrator complex subunit 3